MRDKVDSSFYAAVRAVICFITADGKYDPKERSWFLTLLDGYGFSRAERKKLEADFEDPPRLEDVWTDIFRPYDRDRLMRWARGVTAVDGEVAAAEKDLLARLEALFLRIPKDDLNESYRRLASSMVEFERENRFWEDLGEFGGHFNQRISPFMFGGHFLRFRPYRSSWIFSGIASRNRYVRWTNWFFFILILLLWGLGWHFRGSFRF